MPCFRLNCRLSRRFFENYRKGLQNISYKISKTSDVFRFSSYFLNCFLPQNSWKSPCFCASLSFFFAMNFVSDWNWVANANLECRRYLPSLLFQFNFIRFWRVSRLKFYIYVFPFFSQKTLEPNRANEVWGLFHPKH